MAKKSEDAAVALKDMGFTATSASMTPGTTGRSRGRYLSSMTPRYRQARARLGCEVWRRRHGARRQLAKSQKGRAIVSDPEQEKRPQPHSDRNRPSARPAERTLGRAAAISAPRYEWQLFAGRFGEGQAACVGQIEALVRETGALDPVEVIIYPG